MRVGLGRGGAGPSPHPRVVFMIKWIFILLIVAAIAGLLGMHRVQGAALTGAKWLAIIVLVLFLLVLFGIIAVVS